MTIKQNDHIKLPDSAAPIQFKEFIYLLNSSEFDPKRNVFVPSPASYKIHISSRQLFIVKDVKFIERIKSCIVKDGQGIYIIGGYVGKEKIVTSKCEYFDVRGGKIIQLSKTKLFHRSPSGCFHNNKIYIFSRMGI